MSDTLKDILRQCYQDLGMLTVGTATGGSLTTLVDSTLGGKAADWKYGTAFIDRDVAGAADAPEGELSAVSAYDPGTGTLTSAWTVAPAAGDFYALATPEFRLAIMRSWINRGLQLFGRIPVKDATLTSAASTYLYTTPAAAKGRVKRIFIAVDASATAWREVLDWNPVISATGVAEQIMLRSEPEAGRSIMLVYEGDHPKLWSATDKLNEYVPLDGAVAATCFAMERARFHNMPQLSNKAMASVRDLAADFLRIRREVRNEMPELARPLGLLMGDTAVDTHSHSAKYGPWLP